MRLSGHPICEKVGVKPRGMGIVRVADDPAKWREFTLSTGKRKRDVSSTGKALTKRMFGE
jgi:hypothetical protein